MRAAPEQPPDPSSFAKCCRPHRAQRGPPAPRPTRAASRTPPTPLPRPQTPPSPAADPTHRAPTSPPRPHESAARATKALGTRPGQVGVGGAQAERSRGQALNVDRPMRPAGSPDSSSPWGTRGGPHPPQAPRGGAVAVLRRGDGGRRPGPGLGDTDPVLQSLGRSRLQTSSQAATRGPPAATWAVACIGMSSAQTGRGEGCRPRAWPRRPVHLAVTLGGRRRGDGRTGTHSPCWGQMGKPRAGRPPLLPPRGPSASPWMVCQRGPSTTPARLQEAATGLPRKEGIALQHRWPPTAGPGTSSGTGRTQADGQPPTSPSTSPSTGPSGQETQRPRPKLWAPGKQHAGSLNPGLPRAHPPLPGVWPLQAPP